MICEQELFERINIHSTSHLYQTHCYRVFAHRLKSKEWTVYIAKNVWADGPEEFPAFSSLKQATDYISFVLENVENDVDMNTFKKDDTPYLVKDAPFYITGKQGRWSVYANLDHPEHETFTNFYRQLIKNDFAHEYKTKRETLSALYKEIEKASPDWKWLKQKDANN